MFTTVLVANCAEIAVRIIRTLRSMGISPVSVWSDADRFAPHVALADQAVRLGPAPAADSYLNAAAVIVAARATGAQAVHPGYGFLSENADFAEALAAEGIVFIGPPRTAARLRRETHRPRACPKGRRAAAARHRAAWGCRTGRHGAAALGYPVMLKSTAGGGGIGMRRCDDEPALRAAFPRPARGVPPPCARRSKVSCERQRRVSAMRGSIWNASSPAPDLPEAVRTAMLQAAESLCGSVDYASAGTVEFVYDPDRQAFAFLEVNACRSNTR